MLYTPPPSLALRYLLFGDRSSTYKLLEVSEHSGGFSTVLPNSLPLSASLLLWRVIVTLMVVTQIGLR